MDAKNTVLSQIPHDIELVEYRTTARQWAVGAD